MSNRKMRRALGRASQTKGQKQLNQDVCKVCAFLVSTIIGARAQDFRLQDGTLVELGVNSRLEPPLGIRFPKSAAKRQKCMACAGIGRIGCDVCNGQGHQLLHPEIRCEKCQGNGKLACVKCAGFGINWIKEDFAPTCVLCSQFIMAWLQERERNAIAKASPSASKIILPSTQQARRMTGGIILPGSRGIG